MPQFTASFRCGHPRIPGNIKWRKRAGQDRFQAVCRKCNAKREARQKRTKRERQAEFKEQLHAQLPPADLPQVESCQVSQRVEGFQPAQHGRSYEQVLQDDFNLSLKPNQRSQVKS